MKENTFHISLLVVLMCFGIHAADGTSGLVVSVGDGSANWVSSLTKLTGKTTIVNGLCKDAGRVQQIRKQLSGPSYGMLTVSAFTSKKLPYADRLVNLLILDSTDSVPTSEVARVLVPGGKAVTQTGKELMTAPWPKSIDEWTHYLHGPNNNAVAADTEIGPPRSLRWTAKPLLVRSHEELSSTSSVVTDNGRLFYIIDEGPVDTIRYSADWKLVARDAFNGVLLWKKPIPIWIDHLRQFRSGPAHLPRRLVAEDGMVYVTLGLGAPVTALDGATGKLVRTYKGTEYTEEIIYLNGVLYLAVGTSEVVRKGGGLHTRGEPKPSSFRYVTAINAKTGKRLWKRDANGDDFLIPLSLSVSTKWTVYQTSKGIVCLDTQSGKIMHRIRRETEAKRYGFWGPTVVIIDDTLIFSDRIPAPQYKGDSIIWGVNGWNEKGFPRKGKCEVAAYDLPSGKQLWKKPATEGYNSSVDVFVIGDTVWVGLSFSKGYKMRSGKEVKMSSKGDRVGMAHHRCYRNKATVNWIFTSHDGVEFLEVGKGWKENDSWARGSCQYGVMPANGLIYYPPDSCACNSQVKVQGWNILSAKLPRTATKKLDEITNPLIKGPAYSRAPGLAKKSLGPNDWPMYRRDIRRGGAAPTSIKSSLSPQWSTKIGGKLTAPVAAHGLVYLSSVDAHALHALDIGSGKPRWTFVAGGRIDSAPSLVGGLLCFGSADGWLYCLDARTGELAWRLRCAPMDRSIMAFDQLESSWPLSGSVLIQNGELYCTAGRNSYLDGGIYFYRIDPATGKIRKRNIIRHRDPVTGKYFVKQGGGFDMAGTRNDILTGDGESLFLGRTRFDRDGNEVKEKKFHLQTPTGFLGEEWFVRSYWLYGTEAGTGWGGWARGGTAFFSGRIMCFDDEKIFGYGRKVVKAGPVGHKSEDYHFFSGKMNANAKPTTVTEPPKKGKKGKKPRRGRKRTKYPPLQYNWSTKIPVTVRAMALTKENLIVAALPNIGKKDPKDFAFSNDKEAIDALEGKKGSFLKVYNRTDGKELSSLKLECGPVFDSVIVANGRVIVCMEDGTVRCFNAK